MVVFALSLQVFRKLLKDIYLNMSEEKLRTTGKRGTHIEIFAYEMACSELAQTSRMTFFTEIVNNFQIHHYP